MNVNVLDARNNLSSLLRRIEEDPSAVITITRRGVPIADLRRHVPTGGLGIKLGIAKDKYSIPSEEDMKTMDAELAEMMVL